MSQAGRRQEQLLKKALSPTRACASLQQLDRLGDPHGSLWEHVRSCARCQAELSLLGDFETATPRPEEQSAVSWISMRLERQFAEGRPATPRGGFADPWWKRWFTLRSLGTAGLTFATAMIAVAVTVGLRDGRPPALSAPSGATATAFRSGELSAVSPAGDLDEAPAELRWQALPAAASYSVRVMEVDRTELWKTDTRDAVAKLPEELRARAVPGKPLLWQVTAKDSSGGTIAESAAQRFRVRNREH